MASELSITVSQFLELSGPRPSVISLTSDQSVGEALHTLASNKIMSAPVVAAADVVMDSLAPENARQYLGMIDVQQLLFHAVRILRERIQAKHLDTDPAFKQQCWELFQEMGDELFEAELLNLCGNDAGIIFPGWWTEATLKELISVGFLRADEQEAAHEEQTAHRVLICNSSHSAQVDGIISQSDVVRFVADHPNCFEPGVIDKTLEELEFLAQQTPTEIVSVNQKMSALDAFELMERRGVSGLAVLNDEGQLVGNLSASDLRGMGRHEFGDLLMSVEDFTLINKDQVQGYCLPPDATLDCLLQTFKEKRVHRLYVVDERNSPMAVITLTDVMRLLTQTSLACFLGW
eukprot:TRINITY_DN7239_c0_g1_i13.p1 TRINITY_DN7239_c0_g1~~TRINITY_DN7239_c0_g1_i13.p1  ORF type:complete len:348 (-),score=99.84 TRINITY_DN7239_c0_g1_i13:307-1350(-)